MAISKTDAPAERSNRRIRLASDWLLAKLKEEHREHEPYDNGARERNAAPPLDFHVMHAVALLDG
jgi:hypothetical protein